MEKQVGFESRVAIMSMTPGWPIAILPHQVLEDYQIPSSGEIGWSQSSLPEKLSSTGYARFGLQHSSTHRRSSNYNYGYSTADRPNKPGLLLFSNDDNDAGKEGCGYCAWAQDQQRRWSVAWWTCIGLLSLLILAVVAIVLTWCIIIPRRPYLDLPDQSILIESLTVSPVNTSSHQGTERTRTLFSANFTLQLFVKNPNRVSTDYSSSRFFLAYRDSVLGAVTIPAFSQKSHASTYKLVDLSINNVDVLQPDAALLLTDAAVDSIALEVHGNVHARLQILGLSTPPVLIKLWCSVRIKVSVYNVTDQQCHLSKHKVIW